MAMRHFARTALACLSALTACGPAERPGADKLLIAPTKPLVNVSTGVTSTSASEPSETTSGSGAPPRVAFTLSGTDKRAPAESASVQVQLECSDDGIGDTLIPARLGVDEGSGCRLVADTAVDCTLSILGAASFWAEVLSRSGDLHCDVIATADGAGATASLTTTTGLPSGARLEFKASSEIAAEPSASDGSDCGVVFRPRDCSDLPPRAHLISLQLLEASGAPVVTRYGLSALVTTRASQSEGWFSSEADCGAASGGTTRSVEQRIDFRPGLSGSETAVLCVDAAERVHDLVAVVTGEPGSETSKPIRAVGQPTTLRARLTEGDGWSSESAFQVTFSFLDCAGRGIPDFPVHIAATAAQESVFRVRSPGTTDEKGDVTVSVSRRASTLSEEAGLPILRVTAPLTGQGCDFRGEGL